MKWVYLGIGQAAIFIGLAAWLDPTHRTQILAGGILAAGLMFAQYAHAKRAGLENGGPSTESY